MVILALMQNDLGGGAFHAVSMYHRRRKAVIEDYIFKGIFELMLIFVVVSNFDSLKNMLATHICLVVYFTSGPKKGYPPKKFQIVFSHLR